MPRWLLFLVFFTGNHEYFHDLEGWLDALTSQGVLLAHQPRVIDEAARHHVDLVLCGHTHGG